MHEFFKELKRRNVVRVGIAYAVVGWAIMQFVDIIQDPMDLPDSFQRITIIILAILYPVVLVFSWAFEVTPEGVMKTTDVDKSKSITHGTGQKINKLIIGALSLAVAFLLYDKFFMTPEGGGIPDAQAGQVSIAVLPFVNMSADPEQEYFSDGMTEELLNTLVKIPDLRVAARTSVFAFKGENRDVRGIGRELDVDVIVEGSVRRAGDDLRITAQLIRVEDGFHMWSDTFDRKFENVFAIQEEIAFAITEAVSLPLGLTEGSLVSNRMQNMEAFDQYLKARRLLRGRGLGIEQAIYILRDVVAKEPNFAPAWAMLAVAYNTLPGYTGFLDGKPIVVPRLESKAEMAAVRAVSLDPNLAEAHHAYGNSLRARNSWVKAETHYLRALELDPNSIEILEDTNEFYYSVLDFDKALELAEKAYALEPESPLVLSFYGDALARFGRFEEALEKYQLALKIDPQFHWAGTGIIEIFLMLDDPEAMFEHLEANNGYWRDVLISEARPPMDFGPLESKIRGEEVVIPDGWTGAHWYPYYGYYIGGNELFIEIIDYTILDNSGSPYFYDFTQMDGVLESERFQATLVAAGLVDYWRERGWPKFCWPVGDYDLDCGVPSNE